VTEIRPFSGLRYRVEDAVLSDVLAPPYDVITETDRAALRARHGHNVVRLVLAETSDDASYARAGDLLREWQAQGVIVADAAPALYVLEQRFEVRGGTSRRYGLLARFRAEDYDKRVVLPHEQTRKAPREDRIRLLRASRANYSPIFVMVRDAEKRFEQHIEAIAQTTPTSAYTDDAGVEHRLWAVTDEKEIGTLTRLLDSAGAYIADGHHRYATALRHRDETSADGAWTLGYFTPVQAAGLVVLPYHRILSAGPPLDDATKALSEAFDVRSVASVAEAAHAAEHSRAPYAFGLAQPGAGALVAESRDQLSAYIDAATPPSLRALDPWVFHHVVLETLLGINDDAVGYVHSLREAEEAVSGGHCRLAGLLRSTPVQQVLDVADAGESMPAKSTFFHPKLPSGLVIHPLLV